MTRVSKLLRPSTKSASAGGTYTIGAAEHCGVADLFSGRLRDAQGGERRVAVKRLSGPVVEQPELVQAFQREVLDVPAETHPNLISVIDVVQQDDSVWAVLDDLDGVSLGYLLELAKQRRCRLPASVVAFVLQDVLRGLQELHSRLLERGGLVVAHRAIALDTIFVCRDGSSKLLDLGLSRAGDRTGITHRAHLADALPYMAPEQLKGGRVGPASDTYSLCVLLWEVLTQRRLFKKASVEETIKAICDQPVPRNLARASALDLSFLLPGLDRDELARYQSPDELMVAIQRNLPAGSKTEVARWVCSLAPEEVDSGVVSRPVKARKQAPPKPGVGVPAVTRSSMPKPPPLPKLQGSDEGPTHKQSLESLHEAMRIQAPPPKPRGVTPALGTAARSRSPMDERTAVEPLKARAQMETLVDGSAPTEDPLDDDVDTLPPPPAETDDEPATAIHAPLASRQSETRELSPPAPRERVQTVRSMPQALPSARARVATTKAVRRYKSPKVGQTTQAVRAYEVYTADEENETGKEPSLWVHAIRRSNELPALRDRADWLSVAKTRVSPLAAPLQRAFANPTVRLIALVAMGISVGVLVGTVVKSLLAEEPAAAALPQSPALLSAAPAAVAPPSAVQVVAPPKSEPTPKPKTADQPAEPAVFSVDELPKANKR